MDKTQNGWAWLGHLALALVIAISLLVPAAVLPQEAEVSADPGPILSLEIIKPPPPVNVSVCQNFTVNATVTNVGDADATGVNASISWSPPGGATLVAGDQPQELGTVLNYTSQNASWTLHCNATGTLTIYVSVDSNETATVQKEVQVNQQAKAELNVTILEIPSYASNCQDFTVMARVKNMGEATATGVNATINVTGGASLVTPPEALQLIGNLTGLQSWVFNWTVHCDTNATATINVTATGKDINSDIELSASDAENVTQEWKAHLVANITYPLGGENFTPCQYFPVNVTISNIGEADALNCSGTITIVGNATVNGAKTNTTGVSSGVGTVFGYSSKSMNWTLHCEGPGVVNINVTPSGTDENTGENVTNITTDEVSVNQTGPKIEVEITEPPDWAKMGVCQNFHVTATVRNTGNQDATNVTANITFNTSLAKLILGSQPEPLGTITPGGSETVTWKLHCEAAGSTKITVNATCENSTASDNVTVIQEEKWVDIIEPDWGANFTECQTFGVKAIITNRDSDTTAQDVNATITIAGPAELLPIDSGIKTGTWELGFIDPDEQDEVAWNLHCTGEGDVTIEVCANSAHGVIYNKCDNVTVHQIKAANLTVTVTATPDTVCTECNNTFVVTATIHNDGDRVAENLKATLSKVADGNATITTPKEQTFPGTLAPCETWTVTWNGTCTAKGNVTFEVEATGNDKETLEPISAIGTVTVKQVDFKVEITAVAGIDPLPSYTFSSCQNFTVNATLTNCLDTDKIVNVTIKVDPGLNATLIAGDLVETKTICKCCDQNHTWKLHCDGPGAGHITIEVVDKATEEVLASDSVYIVQEAKAHLVVPPRAIDVQVDDPVSVEAVAVCQNFTVLVSVNNTGEADAEDVEVTVEVVGNVSPSGEMTAMVKVPSQPTGTIPGGGVGTAEWELHCDAEGDVTITVVNVTGKDEHTGKAIAEHNIENLACALEIQQIPFDVVIIQPQTCQNISVCTNFAVKVRITNNSTVEKDIEGVNATLEWSDGTKVKLLSSKTVSLGKIAHNTTSEATWMMHCEGEDEDVALWVVTEAETPKLQVKSDYVIIHQVPTEAHLKVEIFSPDRHSLFATCQEFAVTAKVSNTGNRTALDASVTISGALTSVIPSEDAMRVIGNMKPGTSQIFTWTLHCDKPGRESINVTASATNAADATDSVLVYQYAAAHLEVEIVGYPTTPVIECDTFNVTANITNTGWADAWEVSATLSVKPEDSARVTEGGYTQYIGTLAGHGQNGTATITWPMHCKMACESTITITAAGFDEYGWHKKQECQTTGKFVIEDGYYEKWRWEGGKGFFEGYFTGKAVGLIGPFIASAHFETNITGGDSVYQGDLYMTGYVTSDHMDFEGKVDVEDKSLPSYSNWTVIKGQWDIINGVIFAQWHGMMSCPHSSYTFKDALVNGLWCSTMHSDPGAAILDRFIEPESITVKQVEPAQLEVEVSAPAQIYEGENYHVTAIVTNIGGDTATNVEALLIISGMSIPAESSLKTFSDISGGSSGYAEWEVTCTGEGGVNLVVSAWGDNTNTAADSAAVQQKNVPEDVPVLTVDVSAPAQIYEGANYYVTAVVTNIGDADATGVNATIQIAGDAELKTAGTETKEVGTLTAGSAKKVEWGLDCTGQGGVNIAVSASGDSPANTAVDSVAVQQTVDPNEWMAYLESISASLVSINGTLATISTTLGEIVVSLDTINATLGDIEEAIEEGMLLIHSDLGDINISLEDINATLEDIEDGLASINTTLGDIVLSLDDINATLGDIEDGLVTINTTLGTITSSLDDINATLGDIEDGLVTINTTLGTITTSLDAINGTLVTIEGDLATIATDLGEIQVSLEELVGFIPLLLVDVTAPDKVLVDQTYYVTAVVRNIGLDSGNVNATLAINGPASTTDDLEQVLGDIAAGSSADVTWMLNATAAGGVNLIVRAQGTDTIVATDAAAVVQLRPFEAVWSALSVAPTSGDAPLTVKAEADVTNDGDVAGGCEAVLKVNDVPVDSKVVMVAGQSTGTVGFTYEFAEEGTYQVTINDITPAITVTVGPIVIKPGDANGDGVINVLDLAMTARIIAGLEPDLGLHPGADANEDGVVNVLDLAKIAAIIAGLE